MKYWKKCMEMYSSNLESNGDLDVLPLVKIATNTTESLVESLMTKGDHEDAKIIRLLSLGGVYSENEKLIEKYSSV